jgi:photosystem II stability/assembly factor-like uncharacterized protein
MKNWLVLIQFSVLAVLIVACNNHEQQNSRTEATLTAWSELTRATSAHLRGLDAVNDAIIWASGTEGTVLCSLDSGKTWMSFQVPNCQDIDFRDIEGFDENQAAVMSSGNGVRMYFTENGGQDWALSYEDTNRLVFFDGMDFNGEYGIAYGDPQNGKLSMLQSKDRGRSWEILNTDLMPATLEGEAGFAASGTGIVIGKASVWIATGGGSEARVFQSSAEHSWKAINTPMASGEATGIFSIAFFDDQFGAVVGGNYIDSTRAEANAAYTTGGGQNWIKSASLPLGYRSCVTFNPSGVAIATGRTGTDYSIDYGKNWNSLSSQGYFSCIAGPNYILGVGRNGKIGRMEVDFSQLPLSASETSTP